MAVIFTSVYVINGVLFFFVDDDYDDYDDEGSEKEKYKKEREDEYGVCYLVAKAERKKHVRIKVLQST